MLEQYVSSGNWSRYLHRCINPWPADLLGTLELSRSGLGDPHCRHHGPPWPTPRGGSAKQSPSPSTSQPARSRMVFPTRQLAKAHREDMRMTAHCKSGNAHLEMPPGSALSPVLPALTGRIQQALSACRSKPGRNATYRMAIRPPLLFLSRLGTCHQISRAPCDPSQVCGPEICYSIHTCTLFARRQHPEFV
jgi:hypothetical protein